ncbi:MAG: PqqD family protein [Thermodesulfobacteriota bacterium]
MWFKRRRKAASALADESGPGRERSLSMRPAVNRLVRQETMENGFVRLTYLSAYKPWFAGIARRIGAWDGRPLERKLELDELGTFCFRLIDGERSVLNMAGILAGKYGLPAREAELAVAAFLRELGRRGIVGFREA